MESNPPAMGSARRRSSININPRSSMGSGLPLPRQSKIAMARAQNSQPQFDFLTGAEIGARPQSRGAQSSFGLSRSHRVSSGQHNNVPPSEPEFDYEKYRREMDELKAQLKSLKYINDNHKQEEELAKLRHESELREATRNGEEDFKLKQAAESEKSKAIRQYEALMKEVSENRDATINEKAGLERRLREIEESRRLLEEEVEDVKAEREESLRSMERKSAELEARNNTLQRTVEELQQDSDRREILLQEVQQQLSDKDTAYGALEADVLRLKALTGDAETLGVIKRELSEQVTHIKKLEMFNRKQAAELEHFRQLHESVEVVEEEKRSLQRKVDTMESLQNELGEARIQRQRLEDERRAWTAYLQSQGNSEGQFEFDSPESLARALVDERLERAVLVERLGAVEAELSGKDSITLELEREKAALVAEVEKLKSAGATAGSGSSGSSKAQLRLERQKALAIKEVEYLKAQLAAMDDEDETFHSENMDESKKTRVKELESLVDEYREEVQTLRNELDEQAKIGPVNAEPATLKRPRDDTEDNERLGQLSRKNRKLSNELSSLQVSTKSLQTELAVTKESLAAAQRQANTRVLCLRSNPTSDHEAIKKADLDALRKENADLLGQLLHSSTVQSVPLSTLEACQRDVKAAQAATASEKIHVDRLKKVWFAKTTEFRETVMSLMGWNIVFMPNGRTKVTSDFYPKNGSEENSIEFDGEKGTMKVSGGTRSAFAARIQESVKFWVHDKGSVPCFLAALTIEFFEEANRDKTVANLMD